jgi:hypothetical protein
MDTGRWEKAVYAIVESLGRRGATQDEVIIIAERRYGKGISYSTITARFKALHDKQLLTHPLDGEGEIKTRNGRSGKKQRIHIAKKYARSAEVTDEN